MKYASIPSLRRRPAVKLFLAFIAFAISATCLGAEPVRVLERQGAIHGFLLLYDDHGKEIAVGDQTNQVHGNVIHARTIFHFRDGSIDDEETIYRQGSTFELLRDHHIQKGPAFAKPLDLTVDVRKNEVSWIDLSGKDAQPKSQHMKLPRDLANGMIPLLVQNFPQGAADLTAAMVVFASKPRLVTLDIKPDGSDKVLLGSSGRDAEKFDVHLKLQGVAGLVAPIIGKQPPDIGVWVVDGSEAPVPVFVKYVGPLCTNGPIWTVLLAAPTWPNPNENK